MFVAKKARMGVDNRLLVKVLSKTGNLPRQLPASKRWGNLRYTFDASARNYDWLVVYDDLPASKPLRFAEEKLACSSHNSILLTHEPSAVKIHGSDFVRQFATVMTCHEEWAMAHPNKIAMHPASPWWYGVSGDFYRSYEELASPPSPSSLPPLKDKDVSTICSAKRQSHTLHKRRYDFTRRLVAALPAVGWFGHGVRAIADKRIGLDSYRYHVVVENHRCPHYWTEKLADAFLACALPFYYGCENVADYFPPDSVIPIDINNPDAAVDTIKRAVAADEYRRRLPHILEARRRVLEDHNFFAVITRHIETAPVPAAAAEVIYSRRKLMAKRPLVGVRYMWEKWRNHAPVRRV